jgi:hypothetical protein
MNQTNNGGDMTWHEIEALIRGAMDTVNKRFPGWEPTAMMTGYARAVAKVVIERMAPRE